MADPKRQSTAGKVATPKLGAQAPTEQESTLSKAIGSRILLTLVNNETLEGTIFAADPITHLIAVNTAAPPPNPSSSLADQPSDYNVIPITRIHSFKLLSLPGPADRVDGARPGFSAALPSISKLDFAALKAREEAAVRKLKEQDAKRGRGVTKEAQEIFDMFARTLPTRWHATSIVVNDSVTLKAPYTPSDCSAPKDKQSSLNQIRKILTAYLDKREKVQHQQQHRSNRQSVAVTPAVPKKGG